MKQKTSSSFLEKRKEREALALRVNLLKRRSQQHARSFTASPPSSPLQK